MNESRLKFWGVGWLAVPMETISVSSNVWSAAGENELHDDLYFALVQSVPKYAQSITVITGCVHWGSRSGLNHQSPDSFQYILHGPYPLELVLHSILGGKCSSATLHTSDSHVICPLIHTFSPPPSAATLKCHMPFKGAPWHFCVVTLAAVALC